MFFHSRIHPPNISLLRIYTVQGLVLSIQGTVMGRREILPSVAELIRVGAINIRQGITQIPPKLWDFIPFGHNRRMWPSVS